MTVKVLIKRKFREAAIPEISKMLIQARANVLGKTGYMSSETLRNCENPNEILVLSMWRYKEDWDAYRKDQDRIDLEREFEPLFDGPTEYSVYNMGLTE